MDMRASDIAETNPGAKGEAVVAAGGVPPQQGVWGLGMPYQTYWKYWISFQHEVRRDYIVFVTYLLGPCIYFIIY